MPGIAHHTDWSNCATWCASQVDTSCEEVANKRAGCLKPHIKITVAPCSGVQVDTSYEEVANELIADIAAEVAAGVALHGCCPALPGGQLAGWVRRPQLLSAVLL